MYRFYFILIITTTMIFACKPKNTIEPIKDFKAEKYLGKWYEIARLPNSFEKGLNNITAEYQAIDETKLKVINSGIKEDGETSISNGKATFLESADIARLKVVFFWPFGGEYKVIYLDENYQNAIVCSSGFKYLWILSRSSKLEKKLQDELIQKCADWGFDTSQLIFPKQN